MGLIKTNPIADPQERRKIIGASTRFFLFGSFVLSVPITGFFWALESLNAQRFAQIADILFAPLYWLFSLIFILPALAIAWPCANFALRRGYAGWAIAVTACSILLTLLLVTGFYPTITPPIIALGIASGLVCGTLYWRGAYRKFPDAFETKIAAPH